MNSSFYLKLALSNLKKNKKSYIPYLLTCIMAIMMYYMMYAISINKGLSQTVGADYLGIILGMGKNIIAIFSVIFLFYTNSFLVKQRKKEIGLYNVLGLEKKHIAKMLGFETAITSVMSLLGGILGGLLMSRLMFLILLKLLKFNVAFQFQIEPRAIGAAIVLFTVIFIASFLYNMFQIRLSNPLELLKGGQIGEKEPKTKILLTLIGVVALGIGYSFAIFTESPMQALPAFFLAVILVMIGTYALFVAGSIALLKLLRKNKKFYYQTKHFAVISGMIYRMKQNAVGLANICILSTAVLVTISTTVSLYVGMEDIIKVRYPHEFVLNQYMDEEKERAAVESIMKEEIEKQGLTVKNWMAYVGAEFIALKKGERFELQDMDVYMQNSCQITVLSVSDYNKMEGKNRKLKEDEALIFTDTGNYGTSILYLGDRKYQIIEEIQECSLDKKKKNAVTPMYYLVVSDTAQIKDLLAEVYDEEDRQIYGRLTNLEYKVAVDLNGKEQNKQKAFQAMSERFEEISDVYVENRENSRQSFYTLYGTFLFIGIFLGFMFLMAAVLIIYYKQISEGMEDKERFRIMQNVGMSKKEVRQSIRSQVLMVFFLPLGVAVVHTAVAFRVMTKLLAMMHLTNIPLFFICTLVTVLVFASIYGMVFALTAREYYRIVEK